MKLKITTNGTPLSFATPNVKQSSNHYFFHKTIDSESAPGSRGRATVNAFNEQELSKTLDCMNSSPLPPKPRSKST